MNRLKTNVTILCNRTKTYCDYSILLDRVPTPSNNAGDFTGTWEEIFGNATSRSGFTKINYMKPTGIAYLKFQGIGSQIWLGQLNVAMTNATRMGVVNIFLEVWQHAFPISGEKMAKETKFGPVEEPGIALFWNGIIS
jgi:hypothetical protein